MIQVPHLADAPGADQPVLHPPAHALVIRARLIKRIDRPYLAPVTLITAPAGYGKSTLAAQWAAQTRHAVAWMAVAPEANNVARFLEDLAAAIAAAIPDQTAQDQADPRIDAIVATLDRLAAAGRALTVVLDDYHHIANRDVHRAMDALLARLPPGIHLMLIGRTLPPLALGRLRSVGHVRHLTAASLSFSRAEVEAVVAGDAAARLSPAQIARLAERTGGWIAGLRLALLAIATVPADQVDHFIATFSEHQWLDDYIVEEVLAALPEEVRWFVLRTAGLDTLHPDLCDAVLEIDHSAALIDEVSRRLVFVRRHGSGDSALRYHALFAECVERIAARHIPADERRDHHRRAAQWFELQGRLESAIDHAISAEEWHLAQRIVRQVCRSLRDADQSYSVLHWLAKLPEPAIVSQADLTYWHIFALLATGNSRAADQLLRDVEPIWLRTRDPAFLSYASSCRVIAALNAGDDDLIVRKCYQALRLHPPDDALEGMHAWTAIIESEFRRGNDAAAEYATQQAKRYRERLPAEQRWWTLHTAGVRAHQYAIRGDLTTAEKLYCHALDHLPGQFRDEASNFRYRLARIYLEWNDLDRADAEATRIMSDLEDFPWQYWHPEAMLSVARVHRACGRDDAAGESLQGVLDAATSHGETHTTLRARALQASWWLERGELELAKAWADSLSANDPRWAQTFGETSPTATLLQLHVAHGAHDDAVALARDRVDEGTRLKRWAELVPLHVWEAVAYLGLRNTTAALAALRSALQHSMPGRFVRSFFPAGADLGPFLRGTVHRMSHDEAAYVLRLLAANEHLDGDLDQELRLVVVPAGPESVSAREIEVLELMQEGLVNREIAVRLYITERTVKKHVGNILTKLDAPNRTAAVVHARQLGILTHDSDPDRQARPSA